MHALLRDADVFYANRRDGFLEKVGLSAEEAAALKPGIVHVTVSLHGSAGPWAGRVEEDAARGRHRLIASLRSSRSASNRK